MDIKNFALLAEINNILSQIENRAAFGQPLDLNHGDVDPKLSSPKALLEAFEEFRING